MIINTYWFPVWPHGSSRVSPWGQRLRESRRFCIHTVLDQCVVIQAIASIFSPALFPIWCTIGDIILQLSSQGVAVSGDVRLCTGRWTAFVLWAHARASGCWRVLDALACSKSYAMVAEFKAALVSIFFYQQWIKWFCVRAKTECEYCTYINEMDTKLNPNKICWTKSQLKVHLLYTCSSELSVTRVFIAWLLHWLRPWDVVQIFEKRTDFYI